MRPTRFGFKALAFYAAMVMAFYAMPYSNPFFLLLGFLTLIGAFGILGARRNLRDVTATFGTPDPIPSGATARVPVELANSTRPRFDLSAHLQLASGERISGHIPLLRGRTAVGLESPALPRGCYPITGAVVESRHPFGLITCRAQFALEQDAELVVYPSTTEALEGRSASSALEDLIMGGIAEAGDLQPAGLRDHREGEGMRGVHWRASARRGHLVVQEWEGGRGQGLEVVLDRRASDEDLERALATLSAIVEVARANKETLRLHSQGLSATYGEGGAPWAEALRFLASTSTVPAGGPAPPVTSRSVLRLPLAERGMAHAH